MRIQLGRILTSAAFADAERASSILRFVVERTLEGRTREIKESVIATEVLAGIRRRLIQDTIQSFESRLDACATASVLITKAPGKPIAF